MSPTAAPAHTAAPDASPAAAPDAAPDAASDAAAAPAPVAIGIDVGGTRIKCGAVAPGGVISAAATLPTPSDPRELATLLAAQVRGIQEETGLPADTPVGTAVPGIIDERTETVEIAVNLGWRNVPIGALLREQILAPLAIGHDVRAGAVAESVWGCGDDLPRHPSFHGDGCIGLADLLFVPIGTGVAAALVQRGHVRGDRYAGEIGQVRVEDPLTGRTVRLEEVAAASAIARRYREHAGSSTVTSVATGTGPEVAPGADGPSARDVVDLARSGDPLAQQVLSTALDALGRHLATVIAAVGPVPIVLGGGLGNAGAIIRDGVEAALTEHLGVIPAPPVMSARLSMWAGCQGAALLGRGCAA